MHLFQAQPANFLRAKNFGIDSARAISRIAVFLAAMFYNRGGVEDGVASLYEGRAWCDSSERELNDDITTYRRARF